MDKRGMHIFPAMDIYAKAKAMGLDDRQIALSKMPMTHVLDQQIATGYALDRVLLLARAFDHPGESVRFNQWGFVPHSYESKTDHSHGSKS